MRVLIVGAFENELGVAASMASARGATLARAVSLEAGLSQLRQDGHFDLVICDIGAGHRIETLFNALQSERIVVPIVACSTSHDPEAASAAIREGAREFLPLPPDPELIAAILEAASAPVGSLVAGDPATRAMLRQARRVAGSDASVLICGESGTGKEVVARYLHEQSRRARAPFIAVNCAAIPETLLESELFGHEKGAFSGALARRIGKFEAASGGTLLLDEISEMDLRLQAKLLRAIQEREIDRLGGATPVKVNTRILATSNRSLPEDVATGRFRADLYFRLNVVALTLPPLRERRLDIAPLARHYAEHYARINDLPPRPIALDALHQLEAYSWPGNIRELENLMHRAVLLGEGDEIGIAALGLPAPQAAAAPASAAGIAGLVGQSMDSVERALIVETLSHTLGNRTHAATLLGISIRALRNKLRDYAEQGIAIPAPALRAEA